MEACVVVCRTQKPAERQRRILFIDAVHEVARERAQSFLKPEHQQRILAAYRAFADEPGFARVATIEEVLDKDGNLVDSAIRQASRRRGACQWRRRSERARGRRSTPAGASSGSRWTRSSKCSTALSVEEAADA